MAWVPPIVLWVFARRINTPGPRERLKTTDAIDCNWKWVSASINRSLGWSLQAPVDAMQKKGTAMPEYDFIRVTDRKQVRWLEYNRPPVNAFNRQMVNETRGGIAAALDDPSVRVLVLASAVDGYFSAGADLNEFRGMESSGMRAWVEMCHDIARLLRGSSKPLLAAIDNVAVGGGLEMTLHCDVRFATPRTKLGQPEIQIAFIPPIATTQALTRMIGRSRAIRYLYSGRMVSAEEAVDWGLLDELVAPEDLGRHVQAYAEDLATKPAAALAAIRQAVTLGGGMTFDDGMQLELDVASGLADTADFAEGIDAFLAKRPPNWSGS